MPNPQQNKIQNETEQTKKEINLLQGRLKKNKKSQNKFQNGLMRIKNTSKKNTKTRFFWNQKTQNIVKNILQNKIGQIKKTQNSKNAESLPKWIKSSCRNAWPITRWIDEIAKVRRIKSYEEMTREKLIISLLKSKQSIFKLFNKNLDDDKISDIKRIFNGLRDKLPKKYRKGMKKKLYEIENKVNLSEAEKEKNDEYLRKLVRNLNNKEEFNLYDRDDLDYYGIRDIESLFDKANEEDYYKPILFKGSFNCNYKYYESRGDGDKNISVKQYLKKIRPRLYDLVTDRKIARKVWKIQISIRVNFIFSKDTGETHNIYVWSDNKIFIWCSHTDNSIRGLFLSFLVNYQKELKIISASGLNFESVELMDYKLHKVRLKRGGSYIKSPEWLL